jgi:hypothetical protein
MSGKDLPLISFQPRREIIFKGSNDVAPGRGIQRRSSSAKDQNPQGCKETVSHNGFWQD